jgi:hypothetical protein
VEITREIMTTIMAAIIMATDFFSFCFRVLQFELRAYNLNHSTRLSFFGVGAGREGFEIGSYELFAWVWR